MRNGHHPHPHPAHKQSGGMRAEQRADFPEHWQRDRIQAPGELKGRKVSDGETDVAPPFTSAYKVQNVAAILAGADSPIYTVYWPTSGIVREMAGCVVDVDAPAMGAIGVQITVMDGREDLLKSAAASGNAGPDFNLYASLFGYTGERRCYLQRPIYSTLSWQVKFHNYGASTYTPDLTFFVDEDPHGVRRVQFRLVQVPVGTELAVYGGPGRRRIVIAE